MFTFFLARMKFMVTDVMRKCGKFYNFFISAFRLTQTQGHITHLLDMIPIVSCPFALKELLNLHFQFLNLVFH